MPALPVSLTTPLWSQFAALLPPHQVSHPLGCHRPRIDDRIVFDKLLQVLVFGCSYARIADSTCSATTLRTRRDAWIDADVFTTLEQLALEAYDRMIGLDLADVAVDGCIVKAPCGGEAAGKSPVDRGKLGTKRSVLVDGQGIPLGTVIAPANRHDSPLLEPTLETLQRFADLPETITVHLDAGYDSGKTRAVLDRLGYQGEIASKGNPAPLQATERWPVERTNAWHTRGFRKLAICTERRTVVIEAFVALANAVIIIRRLLAEGWTRYRWEGRPARKS